MADEEQNNQTENEQSEETAEETVSAPEGPVAPAAETEEPAAEEPAAEEPAAEEPAAEEPAAEEPAAEEPAAEEPAAEEPAAEEPAAEEPPAERKTIARVPKPEHPRGRRQERRGVVVSSGMDKTIVVRVDAVKAHRKYQKVVRRSTKFHAHDEENQAKVGDVVRIVETRPL